SRAADLGGTHGQPAGPLGEAALGLPRRVGLNVVVGVKNNSRQRTARCAAGCHGSAMACPRPRQETEIAWVFRLAPGSGHATGFARCFLFAQARPASLFAWLLVVLMSPQFLLHAAALDELLEAAQGHPNGFFIMHPHSQRHPSSFQTGWETKKAP